MPEGIWAVMFAALWVLLLAESVMIVLLSRHMRRLYEERAPDVANVGPALGAVVPEIEAVDIAGQTLALGGPAPRKRLLLFLSPGCAGCRTAIREVYRVPSHLAQIILLWNTSHQKTRDLFEEYQIDLPMVADESQQLWRQFDITGVPFAIVVDEAGRVAAKAFAQSAEQLDALLAPPEPAETTRAEARAPDATVATAR
jgi:peroxiredoxin